MQQPMLYIIIHLEKSLADCQDGIWEALIKYPAYEIYFIYPHLTKKIGTDRPISIPLSGGEYKDARISGGYWICSLNGSVRRLHIIVAEQFIPNPANESIMDHISGITQNHSKII
jgi:hypothetical protein